MSAAGIPVFPFEVTMLRPILIGGTLSGTIRSRGCVAHRRPQPPSWDCRRATWQIGSTRRTRNMGARRRSSLRHRLCAAAIYCQASRRLGFLNEYWFVSGLFFGIGFYLVMNLVVLPLSALHTMGPYEHRTPVGGILIHMLSVGLPISFCLHKLT
jgi:hypothetical protein